MTEIVVRVLTVERARRIATVVVVACVVSLYTGDATFSAQLNADTHTRVMLSVAPIPTTANPSPGTPQVTWSTGDGSPGLVTVTSDGASETIFASGPEGSTAAPWLSAGGFYLFRLYSTVSGRRLLARLKVGEATAAEVVALPQKPRITSAAVDRLLQLLSFGSVALLALLAATYAWRVRHGE